MRILLVDDHSLIRSGLRDTLARHFLGAKNIEIDVLEASNGAQALELIRNNEPELAIVDLFMPGEETFGFVRKLCDDHPDLPVMVLSASENPAHVRKCIDLGASGYVPKAASQQVLLAAVDNILAGGVYIPNLVSEAVSLSTGGSRQKTIEIDFDTLSQRLTGRQMEMLIMVAQGKSNKVIARECDLSDNTVKVHVSAVLKALGLDNRTQLGLLAQKLGLSVLEPHSSG